MSRHMTKSALIKMMVNMTGSDLERYIWVHSGSYVIHNSQDRSVLEARIIKIKVKG